MLEPSLSAVEHDHVAAIGALHRLVARVDGHDVLPADELKAFKGVVGHWHITKEKPDPGPAFNWDRVLTGARWTL